MSNRDRKAPDWKYWQLLGVTTGWEATALSLGIDPRSMTPVASWLSSDVTSFSSNSFMSRQEKDAFYDRLRLLETAFIRLHGDRVSYWNTGNVVLAKFAAWCVDGGLEIPPEFASLANEADAPAEPAASAGKSSNEQLISALERGVTRNAIIGAFPVEPDPNVNVKFWDDKLADPPGWLRSARTASGKRGVPSRWNPLLVAHALLDKKHMTSRQLDKVMRDGFSAQYERWKEETRDVAR